MSQNPRDFTESVKERIRSRLDEGELTPEYVESQAENLSIPEQTREAYRAIAQELAESEE